MSETKETGVFGGVEITPEMIEAEEGPPAQ